MEVYRITKLKWAGHLNASGHQARWNSGGVKVIYTAASRSLACLENVVHRGETGLETEYRTMVIYIPDILPMEQIFTKNLPTGWGLTDPLTLKFSQQLGDQWISAKQTAVFKVPSAIVKHEFNFLLNPAHVDFNQIKIIDIEPFYFDSRLA